MQGCGIVYMQGCALLIDTHACVLCMCMCRPLTTFTLTRHRLCTPPERTSCQATSELEALTALGTCHSKKGESCPSVSCECSSEMQAVKRPSLHEVPEEIWGIVRLLGFFMASCRWVACQKTASTPYATDNPLCLNVLSRHTQRGSLQVLHESSSDR